MMRGQLSAVKAKKELNTYKLRYPECNARRKFQIPKSASLRRNLAHWEFMVFERRTADIYNALSGPVCFPPSHFSFY